MWVRHENRVDVFRENVDDVGRPESGLVGVVRVWGCKSSDDDRASGSASKHIEEMGQMNFFD